VIVTTALLTAAGRILGNHFACQTHRYQEQFLLAAFAGARQVLAAAHAL